MLQYVVQLQKMGIFQANMLEAMKSLREDFQKSTQKTSSQVEVDQTSASASKPGLSNTVHLDPSPLRPRPLSHSVESMEVDYGPAPPPRLGVDSSRRVDDASGLHLDTVEEPSRLPLTRVKKHSHSQRQHDIDPSSASDQYSDQTDDPRPASSRPKKHADKSKHKSRSRYLPTFSEEAQSSVPRHRSPKPSRKTHSDHDQPQHDPDPPYYREVALSDIPSQYAEEVDTFRRILRVLI